MTSLTASFRILFLIVVRAVYTIKYTCMHQLLLIHSFDDIIKNWGGIRFFPQESNKDFVLDSPQNIFW